jgi:hypothetical protein
MERDGAAGTPDEVARMCGDDESGFLISHDVSFYASNGATGRRSGRRLDSLLPVFSRP